MKKGLIVAIILLFVLVLAGFWRYRPNAVVARAADKLAAAKTAAFRSQVVIKSQTAQGQANETQIKLDGAYDKSNVQGSMPYLQTAFNGDIKTTGMTLNVAGEARLLDQAYIHIAQAPPLLPAIAQLQGKWIALPRNEAPAITAPADQKLFEDVDWKGIGGVDGRITLHYRAKATAAAITGLLDNIAAIIGTSLTQEQLKNIADSVTQAGNVPLDVWVSPFTNQIKKIAAEILLPNNSSFALTLSFSNENKLVSIEKPEGAVLLQQLSQTPSPEPTR